MPNKNKSNRGTSCCERGMYLMKHLIYDPCHTIGFVYTSTNAIPGSNVTFLALNVPRAKAPDVGNAIMRSMAYHAVEPGIGHSHVALTQSLFLRCRLVTGERKVALSRTHTTRTKPWTTLYELVPMFEYARPEDWGSRPPFPDASRETQVTSIMDKLMSRFEFTVPNPAYGDQGKPIDLATALLHVNGADKWDADWTKDLTASEIALERQHNAWFSAVTAVFFRKPRGCANCKTLYEPPNPAAGMPGSTPTRINVLKCVACQQVYYCSKDCQKAHWKKHHKSVCKMLQGRLDKDDPRSCLVARTLDDRITLLQP